MPCEHKLTRKDIIQILIGALEPLDYIHSFWEGGAVAFHRIDKWSDIDLYMVVDDNKVDETFLLVEKALETLSPIKQKYVASHTQQSGLYQAFYRLRDANEYLVIDLAVLTLSSPDKFLNREIHGDPVFYFNKLEKIKPYTPKKEMLVKKIKDYVKKLQAEFNMFNNLIQKEINRKNYLEAIDLYHTLTLALLTKALRIKHNPHHYDFRMRYIHYELPPHTIKALKHLYFVKDEQDLQEKYQEANNWFHKVMAEITYKHRKPNI